MNEYKDVIIRSNVSTSLGLLLVSSVALVAGLTIWHVAMGTDPIERVFLSTLYQTDY